MLRPFLVILLGCILMSSCVWKPTYDRTSFLADSLRYELAREKKQRIELQEYSTELYQIYVEKSLKKKKPTFTPQSHFEGGLDIPPVSVPPVENRPQDPPSKAKPVPVSKPVKESPPESEPVIVEEKDLNELIAFPNMRVRNSGSVRIISFPEGAFFAQGSTELTSQAQKYLADLAKSMAGREDFMLDIEGHTDDSEVSKEPGIEDRWDLSAIRATRVLRELVKLGVSPYRIVASGRGQFKPRVPNKPTKNKYKNRRIEIRITPIRPNN